MHKKTKNRLYIACFIFITVSLGICLILYSLSNSIVFFYTPSNIHLASQDSVIRIGGLVKQDSLITLSNNEYNFVVTDQMKSINVHYKGIVSPLFREGQGVVLQGKYVQDRFIASEMLIKHDEKYMPPATNN